MKMIADIPDVNLVVALIAASSSFAGLALGALQKILKPGLKIGHALRSDAPGLAGVKGFAPTAATTTTSVASRLQEARNLLRGQQITAGFAKWTGIFLVLGQFIIGGLLASSFIQQNLPHEMVGALGVVVLVSSLLSQYFRPDVQRRNAMVRIVRLKAAIREAEDSLTALSAGEAGAPSLSQIQRKLSLEMAEIEALEIEDPKPKVLDTNKQENGDTNKRETAK
jgi:hypothetical protein